MDTGAWELLYRSPSTVLKPNAFFGVSLECSGESISIPHRNMQKKPTKKSITVVPSRISLREQSSSKTAKTQETQAKLSVNSKLGTFRSKKTPQKANSFSVKKTVSSESPKTKGNDQSSEESSEENPLGPMHQENHSDSDKEKLLKCNSGNDLDSEQDVLSRRDSFLSAWNKTKPGRANIQTAKKENSDSPVQLLEPSVYQREKKSNSIVAPMPQLRKKVTESKQAETLVIPKIELQLEL